MTVINIKNLKNTIVSVLSEEVVHNECSPYVRAIKLCRNSTGKSLKEAKDFVDSVKAEMVGRCLDGFSPQEFWFFAWKGKPGKRGLITTLCASTRTHLIQKAEANEGMTWSAIRRRGGVATKCKVSWMLP